MGASQSSKVAGVDLQQVEELKMVANFHEKEIVRLLEIFAKLDSDKSGSISKAEIYNVPSFKHNPFIGRILAISYKEEQETITLKEFAHLMSVFSVNASREEKLRFAFKIYDDDDDGKISRNDLKVSLKLIVQDAMDESFLDEVVDKVMEEADVDHDGFIVFEDFSKVVMNTDVEGRLTVEF